MPRWVVVDSSGREMKGQPKEGFSDYQDAYDFAEQHYTERVRIESR